MADEYEGKEDMGGDMIDESKYDQDDPNGVMDERYDDDDDDMGYDDMDLDAFGEGLPPFASKAARELDALVKDKERTLDEIDGQLGENSERVEIMQEHLKNVRQELLHTQALVDAKNREIGTESHLKQLAERGIGRVKSDIRKKDNEREDLQDSLNVIQNAIFRGNEKMDQFKLQMNWNQEELEQWALAAKQKEEDSLALQKYTRADEAKVKELTLQIQKVTQEVSSSKKKLDDEVTDTQAKQIELDKTAEEFRALHRERQQLVRQWQESVEAMKRRDEEIERAKERFVVAKGHLRQKQELLAEQEQRLQLQNQDNSELESKVSFSERKVGILREKWGGSGHRLQEFKDEVDVVRNELSKAASDLVAKRNAANNERQVLVDKRNRLEAARKRYVSVKRKLEKSEAAMLSAEAVAKQAEDELDTKNAGLKWIERELVALKEQMFKQSQELFRLRQEEANQIAEISGAQAAAKNLTSKIHKLDEQSLRQQELIYNAEFQIQQLERKVARAGGDRSDEEKKVLNAKIAELQAQLDDVLAQHAMLVTQQKKLSDELRSTKRTLVKVTEEKKDVEARIAELELVNSAAELTLKKNITEKEELMVNHDTLKLEVKRLKEQMNDRADEVFGLENRKFQLQMSMEERKKEISVHRDVQRAQLKIAEEERHKVGIERQERFLKVQKLKSKFETICGNIEDQSEEKSQAYFVIQAAQVQEELQREGDELDAKIRKSEREIRALESTLKHLNVRNQNYRSSFHRADMGSKEAQDLRSWEEQAKTASDRLFKKRKELQRMQADFEEDQRRLAQVDEQTKQLTAHVQHLADAQQQVEQELDEQMERHEMAHRRVEALSAAHRHSNGVSDSEETMQEKQFRAAALAETNSNVLYTLGQLAKEFPEMQESLEAAIQSQGLNIPSRPPSRMSSAAGSRMSSRNGSRPVSQGGY